MFSIGQKRIGKSTLLNNIFDSDFEIWSNTPLHDGIDVAFSSDEYELGFNLFDFHGDALENLNILEEVLQILPSDIWIII